MARAALAAATLLAGALLSPGALAEREAASHALDELRALAAEFPEDADLAWTLVSALEEEGELDEAAQHTARFVTRWPGRRGEARTRLGRLLYELGRWEEALEVFEDALFENPLDGPAQLYRGLALRGLGRADEAERALLVAARLEAELEPETLLLRGLARLERGETAEGRSLLQDVIDLAPSSESARQATLLLGGSPPPPKTRSRLALFAHAGGEADSNVTLEGEIAPGGSASDERDTRAVWGAGFSYRAFETETSSLTLGYRYGGSEHRDLKPYDVESHLLFASAAVTPQERAALRLDVFASDTHLDGERYLRTWSLRPNVMLTLGERAGVTRLYWETERAAYHDEPFLPSLRRDGTTHALGLEHYVPIPGAKRAWASLGTQLSRLDTEARRDLLGFDGAFDHRRGEGKLRVHVPLVWKIETEVSAAFAWERYTRHNVIDALLESGLAGADRRRDHVAEATFLLARPLTRFTRVEVRWRGTRQRSNIDTYSHDRQIVGIYFRAQTF